MSVLMLVAERGSESKSRAAGQCNDPQHGDGDGDGDGEGCLST